MKQYKGHDKAKADLLEFIDKDHSGCIDFVEF